jgi:hypothetical protein
LDRWTFLIIAGPDGSPLQIRVFLRAGDDPDRWPVAQVGLDGAQVEVDEVAHDYEAPEWKTAQILDPGTGGAGQARLDAVKDHLRANAPA